MEVCRNTVISICKALTIISSPELHLQNNWSNIDHNLAQGVLD